MATLRDVPCGKTVKVKKLAGEGPVKRRIMDMGITKGVDVYYRELKVMGIERAVQLQQSAYERALAK